MATSLQVSPIDKILIKATFYWIQLKRTSSQAGFTERCCWRDDRVWFSFKNWDLFFGRLQSRMWEMNLLLTQRRGSGNCLFYPQKLWMSIRQKVACSFADSVILWNWLRWFQKVFGQCKCMSLEKGLPNPVKVYRSQEAMAFQLWSYFSSSA